MKIVFLYENFETYFDLHNLDRLDGLKKKSDHKPQTMEEFLQVPDYYNIEDISGKKHVSINYSYTFFKYIFDTFSIEILFSNFKSVCELRSYTKALVG